MTFSTRSAGANLTQNATHVARTALDGASIAPEAAIPQETKGSLGPLLARRLSLDRPVGPVKPPARP